MSHRRRLQAIKAHGILIIEEPITIEPIIRETFSRNFMKAKFSIEFHVHLHAVIIVSFIHWFYVSMYRDNSYVPVCQLPTALTTVPCR